MFKFLQRPPVQQTDLAYSTGVQALWEEGITGEGVTVALLDTGVKQEVLGERFAWEVDLTSDHDPRDSLGHGSVMSTFILGYAPKARIASIKVVDKDGLVTRDILCRALDLCARKYPEIRLVNISLGVRRRFWRWCWCTFEKPCSLCSKTNQVSALGLIVVVAAGNLGPGLDTITCPGMAKESYCVGAVEEIPKGHWERFLASTLHSVYYRLGEGHTGTSVSTATATGGIALLLSGLRYLKLSEARDALKLAATSLDAAPNEAGAGMAHYYRAYKFLCHKRAAKTFDPDGAIVHYENGQALREQEKHAECLLEFQKATELAPTSYLFYHDLGLAYLETNDLPQALTSLQESVRLYWNAAISHNNIGAVLEKLDRNDEALKHYRIALKLDPQLKEAAYNIGRLTRIAYS